MIEHTRDAIFGGAVTLVQPARRAGYRVNVDALLLAAFAANVLDEDAPRPRTARRAFDLGAGVGAVGLSLLHLRAAHHVTMIEIDPRLCELARANAEANRWTDRIDVVCGDARACAKSRAGEADLVVANPPYVPAGRGRVPSRETRASRQGDVTIFLDAARALAGRRARVCIVYPAIEATTLLVELRARGLEPKRLRAVHGSTRAPAARVVLVECVAGRPGGLRIEPPFLETDAKGTPTPALSRLLDR